MTLGKLILMPNTLDFGVDDSLDLREVLPQRVIETAARLTHWAAENAKTTRALLEFCLQTFPSNTAFLSLYATSEHQAQVLTAGFAWRLGGC